jgi:hypothetical protein
MDEAARPPRVIDAGAEGFFFRNSSVRKFFGAGGFAFSFLPQPKKERLRCCIHGTRKDSGEREEIRAEAIHQLALSTVSAGSGTQTRPHYSP